MGARRFDVLVVGAGPAGSIAALVLARAGARVGFGRQGALPDGTRRAATSSGRGACRCSPTSGCPRPPGSTSATWSSSGRPAGGSCSRASTAPPTRAEPAPSPGACSTTRCARPRSTPAPNPSRAAPTSPSGPMPVSTASWSTAASRCTPTSSSGPTVRPAVWRRCAGLVEESTGAVGVRRALLPRPARRPPGHHAVGTGPLARLSRLRLDLPRPRRRRQRRHRHRDPGGPPGRGRGGATAARLPRASGEARAPRRGVSIAVAAPAGRLAQDGHGRDDARRRAGAAGRRCRRTGQPPPG